MELNQEEITKRIEELVGQYQSSRAFAVEIGLDPGNFKKKRDGQQPWTVKDVNIISEKLRVR